MSALTTYPQQYFEKRSFSFIDLPSNRDDSTAQPYSRSIINNLILEMLSSGFFLQGTFIKAVGSHTKYSSFDFSEITGDQNQSVIVWLNLSLVIRSKKCQHFVSISKEEYREKLLSDRPRTSNLRGNLSSCWSRG